MRWKFLLFAVALVLAAVPALAQGLQYTPPTPHSVMVWSPERWSFGIGADYEFLNANGQEPLPPFDHEWDAGAFVSWAATKHTSLSGSAVYGFDNKFVRWKGDARLALNEPTDPIAFQLGLGYVIYDAAGEALPPTFAKEWEVSAYAGKIVARLSPQAPLIAGVSGHYGLDNQRGRLELALRLGYTLSKGGY